MMNTTASEGPRATERDAAREDDDVFARDFLAPMSRRFQALTFDDGASKAHLFTTACGERRGYGDASSLFEKWLAWLPPDERRHHECRACRRFFDAYADLVVIDKEGRAASVMFGAGRGIFAAADARLAAIVKASRVTGVHISSSPVYGTPSTRDKKRAKYWQHASVPVPKALIYPASSVKKADQRAAELREDYAIACRGLAELGGALPVAVEILRADALTMSEKFLGPAEWLLRLHEQRSDLRGPARDNVMWRAIASAPTGYAHVKSSMIGSLLEDITAGMDLEVVKRRFANKVHPLRYQRPVAPPTEGAIARAEKIVDDMGIASALRRRFAKLEDVVHAATWTPPLQNDARAGLGVFGHLRTGPVSRAGAIRAPISTWEKFLASGALVGARKVEIFVGHGHEKFYAFTTQAAEDALPIIAWDAAHARNPVSWYTHVSGSPARQWGIAPGWCEVLAVVPFPNRWQPGYEHHGDGALFVLPGCCDSANSGLALFPAHMRGELREVRAVIEAHSNRGKLEGDDATASGLAIRPGEGRNVRLRITSRATGLVTEVEIDRWS